MLALRRVRVVPNDASLLQPVAMLLVEPHNEWASSDRRYCCEVTRSDLWTLPPL